MERVVTKFILQLLPPEQKKCRTAAADELIQTAPSERDFLKKAIALKGTKGSLSYVQCFLCLLSSLIKVSIFLMAWLETLWTDYMDL